MSLVKAAYNPKVTVLMSCFNGERWLSESINSVLNQSYTNFEFIIIDDGSTDRSRDVIKSFEKIDSRIILFSKANTGLADSLNYGIKNASGSWIARLDADDFCLPYRLERQVEAALQSDSIVFIGSDFEEIDMTGQVLSIQRYPSDSSKLVKNLVNGHRFPPHSSAFYKTSVVQALGGYRARIRRAEDFDLWLRLSRLGGLSSIPEVLVKIRKHPGQISNDNYGRQQFLDSKIALISYHLVNSDRLDPVNLNNNLLFDKFSAWVTLSKIFNDAIIINDYVLKIKSILKSKKYTEFFFYLIRRPKLFFKFLLMKYKSENVSRLLAEKLMKENIENFLNE